MKLSWGTGIILSFAFFMCFIGYLVYGTLQENIDLVAEDYYQQEVVYQDVIDKKENYNKLSDELTITQQNETVLLKFPHRDDAPIKGEVYFFRSSDKTADIKFEVSSKHLTVSKKHLTEGSYLVRCTWLVDEVSYYHELPLFVQK